MLPIWTHGGDPMPVRHFVQVPGFGTVSARRAGIEPCALVAVLKDFPESRCDWGFAPLASVIADETLPFTLGFCKAHLSLHLYSVHSDKFPIQFFHRTFVSSLFRSLVLTFILGSCGQVPDSVFSMDIFVFFNFFRKGRVQVLKDFYNTCTLFYKLKKNDGSISSHHITMLFAIV